VATIQLLALLHLPVVAVVEPDLMLVKTVDLVAAAVETLDQEQPLVVLEILRQQVHPKGIMAALEAHLEQMLLVAGVVLVVLVEIIKHLH